jgi:predicted nuclease of predicted toxin-antitoxin system
MKLLFDQNISYRVIKKIITDFPLAVSVSDVGLYEEDDIPIWKYALKNEYTIVSQDSDFDDLYLAWGHPPKIIRIMTGNISNSDLARLLIARKNRIESFINSSSTSAGRLEINHIEVIENEN